MATTTLEMLGTVRPDGTLDLDQKVTVASGRVKVRLEPVESPAAPRRKTLAEQLGDLVGSVPDLPSDMADQHDHYLHGAPKR